MKLIFSETVLLTLLISWCSSDALDTNRTARNVLKTLVTENTSKVFLNPVTEVVHIPATTGAESDSTETKAERVLVVVRRSHHLNQDIFPSDLCGGVLVSPRIVITAAHCFYDSQRRPHMFGVTYQREGGIFWDVTRNGLRANLLVAHPGYKENGKINDIGAMRLETAVCERCLLLHTEHTIPRGLWRGMEEEKVEMLVFVIENEHYANIRLDRIPVRWTNKFACDDAYHRWGIHITPKQICIEPLDPHISHRGESAILLVNDHPIGVFSFKLDVDSTSHRLPYIYTDLTRYPDFIQKKIRNDATAHRLQPHQPYRICSSILYVVISLGIVE